MMLRISPPVSPTRTRTPVRTLVLPTPRALLFPPPRCISKATLVEDKALQNIQLMLSVKESQREAFDDQGSPPEHQHPFPSSS